MERDIKIVFGSGRQFIYKLNWIYNFIVVTLIYVNLYVKHNDRNWIKDTGDRRIRSVTCKTCREAIIDKNNEEM